MTSGKSNRWSKEKSLRWSERFYYTRFYQNLFGIIYTIKPIRNSSPKPASFILSFIQSMFFALFCETVFFTKFSLFSPAVCVITTIIYLTGTSEETITNASSRPKMLIDLEPRTAADRRRLAMRPKSHSDPIKMKNDLDRIRDYLKWISRDSEEALLAFVMNCWKENHFAGREQIKNGGQSALWKLAVL